MPQRERSRRSIVEHERKKKTKQDQQNAEARIAELIGECSRALESGGDIETPHDVDFYYILEEKALALSDYIERYAGRDITDLADDIVTTDKHDALTYFTFGLQVDTTLGRRRLVAAFEGLVSIAESLDVVDDEVRNRATAVGLALKTGEQIKQWDMNLGESVQTVSLQAGTLKTLFCGQTGLGKSCGLETEAEDFYQRGRQEGRDYKLIDLVDLGKGESWIYDIPQRQDDLANIREEMGLPRDFTEDFATVVERETEGKQAPFACPQCEAEFDTRERLTEHGEAKHEYATPEVEIRLPMTPGLSTEELPYDTEHDEFTVKPFVIPASEIRKPILVNCILSRVSDQQENTIRQAYDDVDREHDDWSLKDIADEIRSRDELSPKHKADAVGVLQALQDEGFIRTKDHPMTIDWREMFFDTETITVFSQAFVPDSNDVGQMICLAYLIDRMLTLREKMYEVPECALLMREFWEVAPHTKRQSSDERAAAIQEAIGDRMVRAFRKNRNYKLHLLCDTQEPGDLLKSVREVFNRYVVYSANRDTIKNIFDWTQNDKNQSFWGTMTAKKGQAGIVGQVKPAIDRRDIEFLSPVEYAPPSHHHFDKLADSTGWTARASHLDHEELRCPHDVGGVEWDDQLPDELQIANVEEESGPSVEMRPVVAFANQCLKEDEISEYVPVDDVRAAFNAYLAEHNEEPWDFSQRSETTKFGNRIREGFRDGAFDKKKRKGSQAYVGLSFTRKGEDYFRQTGKADDEEYLDSSAAPIQGDD